MKSKLSFECAKYGKRLFMQPEAVLVIWGGLVNLIWEFGHSSLYTDGAGSLWYILWSRTHCTVGDIMILTFAFYGVSIIFRSRYWWKKRGGLPKILFVLFGFSYTVWSEWYNINIAQTWQYTSSMPTILGFGLSPLFQWVLGPLVVLWKFNSIDEAR